MIKLYDHKNQKEYDDQYIFFLTLKFEHLPSSARKITEYRIKLHERQYILTCIHAHIHLNTYIYICLHT